MSRSSCIAHPPSLPYTVLTLDYLIIANEDACAAKLLKLFESWTNSKIQELEQTGFHNSAAQREGLEPIYDENLWLYNSVPNLRRMLLLEYSEKKIYGSLKTLVDEGFLSSRKNPKYKWDQTLQYLFNIQAVQTAIRQITVDQLKEFTTPRPETLDFMHPVNLPDRSSKPASMHPEDIQDASGKTASMHPVNLPDGDGTFTGSKSFDLPDDPKNHSINPTKNHTQEGWACENSPSAHPGQPSLPSNPPHPDRPLSITLPVNHQNDITAQPKDSARDQEGAAAAKNSKKELCSEADISSITDPAPDCMENPEAWPGFPARLREDGKVDGGVDANGRREFAKLPRHLLPEIQKALLIDIQKGIAAGTGRRMKNGRWAFPYFPALQPWLRKRKWEFLTEEDLELLAPKPVAPVYEPDPNDLLPQSQRISENLKLSESENDEDRKEAMQRNREAAAKARAEIESHLKKREQAKTQAQARKPSGPSNAEVERMLREERALARQKRASTAATMEPPVECPEDYEDVEFFDEYDNHRSTLKKALQLGISFLVEPAREWAKANSDRLNLIQNEQGEIVDFTLS